MTEKEPTELTGAARKQQAILGSEFFWFGHVRNSAEIEANALRITEGMSRAASCHIGTIGFDYRISAMAMGEDCGDSQPEVSDDPGVTGLVAYEQHEGDSVSVDFED